MSVDVEIPVVDRRSLANRPVDRALNLAVAPGGFVDPAEFFTTRQIAEIVASGTLADTIEQARETERGARAVRLWLESLAAGQHERTCPVCGATVRGRADRVYCSGTCRQRALRSRV